MIYTHSSPIISKDETAPNNQPLIDLSLYQYSMKDQLRRDAKRILIALKLKELNIEHIRFNSTELNSLENVYLEAINEIRFEKLYPGIFDRFKELEWLLVAQTNIKILIKNEIKYILIINANNNDWSLSLFKEQGEYRWNCKRLNASSIQFKTSHYHLIQTGVEIF